jgi:integrase
MSVFKAKARGGWVAKFQHGGKQHWTPGGPWPTKRQAQEAQRRHRDRLEARRTEETCASFAERWLEEWPRAAASTRRNYADAARRFAEEFGPTPLADVERLSARAWALTVPRGISRVVGIMYEDARNIGLVESNPFSRLSLPPAERRGTITPPTMEEYRRLLEACTVLGGYGPEFRAMIQFSAWTGVRAGELHALEWDDVEGEVIQIRRSRRRDGSIGPPKNGKARTIAFLPPARVLESVSRRRDAYVFHSPRGNPLIQGSHHYAWRAARAAAALPGTRWHDLRHFCATQLLEMGRSHFDVAVQLGHEDGGALVMARYGHPSKDAARERLLRAFSLEDAESGSATGSSRSHKAHVQAE